MEEGADHIVEETSQTSVPDGDSQNLPRTVCDPLSTSKRTLTRTVSSIRFGVHSIQNQRSEMEDAHRAVLGSSATEPNLNDSLSVTSDTAAQLGSFSFFAVFDGHGGACAAEFCGEHVYTFLVSERDLLFENPEEAVRRALIQTEVDWLVHAKEKDLMDGTTAAVVLVDRTRRCCVVGNVGDTEVLLGTKDVSGHTSFRVLTEVHHLQRNSAEIARVVDAGGSTWKNRLKHPRFVPQVVSLAVSRSIGDIFFKDDEFTLCRPSGLTADPYVTVVDVCTSDIAVQFLLICCDGLWDVVSYGDASDYVFTCLAKGDDPQMISEGLVALARDAGSSDNITVMVSILREG